MKVFSIEWLTWRITRAQTHTHTLTIQLEIITWLNLRRTKQKTKKQQRRRLHACQTKIDAYQMHSTNIIPNWLQHICRAWATKKNYLTANQFSLHLEERKKNTHTNHTTTTKILKKKTNYQQVQLNRMYAFGASIELGCMLIANAVAILLTQCVYIIYQKTKWFFTVMCCYIVDVGFFFVVVVVVVFFLFMFKPSSKLPNGHWAAIMLLIHSMEYIREREYAARAPRACPFVYNRLSVKLLLL